MSELARVAAALGEAADAGEMSVLATVVRTEGSTYRRIGARLVARRDGVRAGAVSAGCLEADMIARMGDVLAVGEPTVVTYDSRSPEDLVWGFGLGCGGLVEVLLEPLTPRAAAAASARFAGIATQRWRSVLATVIRAPARSGVRPGEQSVIVDERASAFEGLRAIDDTVRRAITDTARRVLDDGRSVAAQHPCMGEQLDIAYELVVPSVRLAVCGASVDAQPVVAAAKHMGWHVTLIDDRPAMANADRWPSVDRIIVADPRRIDLAVAAADCDATIIMSHNYERDLEYLGAWITRPTPYIGMLGPRQRTEQMIAALNLHDSARQRIHGPVGLDIGAETAEEIALAIVAEVQAAHTGRSGGALSQHDGPIHGPAATTRTRVPQGSTVTPSCVTA